MRTTIEKLSNKIAVALGEKKADTVLKNANIVDILNYRIIKGDVAITDGIIVGVGEEYSGEKEVDCTGKYVMPSFFDTHIHFESSLITPDKYLMHAIPHGMTMINADCHEIANVCGEDGMQFMIDCVKGIPVDINFMLPSCVPATPFEHANAYWDAETTRRLLATGKYFGLGEMMNYPGIMMRDPDVLGKIVATEITDGHAPCLTGKMLNAYLTTDIHNDHECETAEEAFEKISKGMYVMLRQGSQTKNLATLVKAYNGKNGRRFILCTDDKHIDEVKKYGTIQNNIVLAVDTHGVDPYDAIAMASLNAYECYGIKNLGAVAINYYADLVVADDIVPRNIVQVYKNGQLVAENGKALFDLPTADKSKVINTVNRAPLTKEMFTPKFVPNKTPVIQIVNHSAFTKKTFKETTEGLNMCAVIERHKATGNIGTCWVEGFGLKGGAIAQTVGHDSHNISVMGDNEADMLLAVETLGKDGGMVVVVDGKVEYKFTLDIAGLMSSKSVDEVIAEHITLKEKTKAIVPDEANAPFMLLSVFPLIVIPEIKLSDSGIFDVLEFKFIDAE